MAKLRAKAAGATPAPARLQPLTLGVYLDAHAAAMVDDGAPFDAGAAPPDVCRAVVSALLAEPPAAYESEALLRATAAAVWAAMQRAAATAQRRAARLRAQVEETLGEGLPTSDDGPSPYALERALAPLGGADYAAMLGLPLGRALIKMGVGAVVRQADEALKRMEEKARLN